MSFKDFKESAQEPVSTQHACGTDLDRGDIRFVRYGLQCRWRRFCWTDECATLLGYSRIADAHRNAVFNRRLNCLGMKNFRAEVSKLGGFTIRQVFHCLRFRNHSRIRSQNARYVRPDLYLTHVQRRSDKGRSVVRASASEGSCCSLRSGGDKSAENRNNFFLQERPQLVLGVRESFSH